MSGGRWRTMKMNTGTVTDREVVATHNGRPTVVVVVSDDQPIVHWLLVGYTEEIDVWLDLPLGWDEADAFVESPPRDLEGFLCRHAQEIAFLRLLDPEGQPVAELEWKIPTDGVIRDALSRLLQQVEGSPLPQAQQAGRQLRRARVPS